MTQKQLADKLDINRSLVDYYETRSPNPSLGFIERAYAYWERHPVALRPDQLEQLAEVVQVPIADLLEDKEVREKKRGNGPTGKMKRLFEKASELPRHQQQKVTAVLEAFIAQQTLEKRNNFK